MTVDATEVIRGRSNSLPFLPDKVIDGYKQEIVLQACPDCLVDIIPRLYDNQAEREILESWKRHFRAKDKPFVVTKMQISHKRWPSVFSIWTIDLN